MNLPTITLHQPWASLVIWGVKRSETRSWAPPPGLVGQRIGIHAGKRVTPACDLEPELASLCALELGETWEDEIVFGALLGIVKLVGAAPSEQLPPMDGADRVSGNWAPGRWIWRVEAPERFPDPIPMRGYQKIWTARLG